MEVLTMISVIVALLSVPLPLTHLALSRLPTTPVRIIHLLLLYALWGVLGVLCIWIGDSPG